MGSSTIYLHVKEAELQDGLGQREVGGIPEKLHFTTVIIREEVQVIVCM